MRKLLSEKGHIYLEAIIAILFLGLVFPTVLTLVVQSQRMGSFASSVTVATNLARERLEFFKRFEMENPAFNRSHPCWNIDDEVWQLNGKQYRITSRVIPADQIPDNAIRTNQDIIPLEVRVSWQEGTKTETLRLASYYLNDL